MVLVVGLAMIAVYLVVLAWWARRERRLEADDVTSMTGGDGR